MMVVAVGVLPPVAEAPPENRGADADDEQARAERQPRVKPLRNDERRERERDDPEREDADRVRGGDDQAERDGVARPAACPHEVPGDDRLAVTRRERVGCAPEGGQEERNENPACPELAGDQGLVATARSRRRRAPEWGRDTWKRAGAERRRGGGDPEGVAEKVFWIGAERVGTARRGHARGLDSRTATGSNDDLAPAEARSEVRIPIGEARPGGRRLVDGGEAQGLQPARAGAELALRLDEPKHCRPAVERELQSATDLGGEAGPAHTLPLLERRDLREIEHVVDVDPVAGDLDRAVAVDGEVAKRVRGGRGGENRRQRDQEEDEALHATALRATGAHRSEKCGLSRSARVNQRRASAFRPRQRSIIPRWKNLGASSVPSRRARLE
jgi:hypothetical protein